MTRRQRRIVFLVSALGLVTMATVLVFAALGYRVLFLFARRRQGAQSRRGQAINLGGLVERSSVVRPGGVEVRFKIPMVRKRDRHPSHDLPICFAGSGRRRHERLPRRRHFRRHHRARQARRNLHAPEVASR
jgi:hypothetical protein